MLCPSGRLTICDWVATGDWSPERYRVNHSPDRPRVSIQTAGNADGAVVDGLRPDVAYPVTGEFARGEGAYVHPCKLSVTIRNGCAVERVEVGATSLWYGRMVVVDAALEMHWDEDISADGLADVAFWGRHGAEVAAEVGAGPLTSPGEGRGVFGWRDLPLAEAERIARDLEARRSQGKGFVVDLRPHTEQWRHLEDLRRSRTRSVAIGEDGARLILFESDFGYHLCFIGADLDAAGQLLRIIVDLERDSLDEPRPRTASPPPPWPTAPTTRTRVGTPAAARDTTKTTGSAARSRSRSRA